jgi:hypothetical protein
VGRQHSVKFLELTLPKSAGGFRSLTAYPLVVQSIDLRRVLFRLRCHRPWENLPSMRNVHLSLILIKVDLCLIQVQTTSPSLSRDELAWDFCRARNCSQTGAICSARGTVGVLIMIIEQTF